MEIASNAPLTIGGLTAFGLFFVLVGYYVSGWPWLLLGLGLTVATLAIGAVASPDREGHSGFVFLILLLPAAIAFVCTGLGVGLRSIVVPREDL